MNPRVIRAVPNGDYTLALMFTMRGLEAHALLEPQNHVPVNSQASVKA
jgi:hypothetical protein